MSVAPAARRRAPLWPRRRGRAGAAAVVVWTASLFATGPAAEGVAFAAFAVVLVWLSALDIDYRLLPNRLVLPAAAIVFASRAALEPRRAGEFALAAVGASLFLLLPAFVRPSALGMGDVKLGILLGAGLGSSVAAALIIGFLAAAIAALALVAAYGRDAMRLSIPLAPFLSLGAIALIVTGAVR